MSAVRSRSRLAVIDKHGHPLFIALPLDEALLRHGAHAALATKLFQEGVASLGRAAKLAGLDYEAFVERLGSLGIPAVSSRREERDWELAAFEWDGRRRRRSADRLRSPRAD